MSNYSKINILILRIEYKYQKSYNINIKGEIQGGNMTQGQSPSSLNKENVNKYINFLLSVTRKNQKIIHSSVNDILYNYVISRCTQLNCSISEYIKRLIIRDMLEHNNISISTQADHKPTINTNNSSPTAVSKNNDYITKKEFEEIENIVNHKKIRNEINELDRKSRELLKRAEKLSKKVWKYSSQEYIQIKHRNEALRKWLLSLKKLKIPRIYYDDLIQIARRISDIDELLK